MPVTQIGLPLQSPSWRQVRFAYLSRDGGPHDLPCGSLLYLRSARITVDQSQDCRVLGQNPSRRQYQWKAPYYAQLLAQSYGDSGFDAVLSPPSRYSFSHTFKSAFLRTGRVSHDLSGWFSRDRAVYAGSGASYRSYFNALSCRGGDELSAVKRLLIVDDILWRGTTAAALLEHMARHGLPRDAVIHLACPLWIT